MVARLAALVGVVIAGRTPLLEPPLSFFEVVSSKPARGVCECTVEAYVADKGVRRAREGEVQVALGRAPATDGGWPRVESLDDGKEDSVDRAGLARLQVKATPPDGGASVCLVAAAEAGAERLTAALVVLPEGRHVLRVTLAHPR